MECASMVFFRWIFGLPLAGLVTIALFAMMAGLIKIDRGHGEPRDTPEINILPTIIENPPIPNPVGTGDPKLVERPPVEIPPAEPSKVPGPIVSLPPGQPEIVDPDIGRGGIGGPVIRYNPPYPDSCRSRGATGIVLVQFDVSPEGNVINARVIDAPDRCFNRIISTVSKWKYPPAFENGRPVTRYGIVERFDFQLTE